MEKAGPQNDWIALICSGDRNAMNALVQKYYVRIFHYLWRYMGNKEVAKDLTQATFTIVLARLRQLRDPGKLTSWIYRIAHNEAHAEVMRRGRLHLVAMDHQHDIEDAGQNKLEEMEKKERGELIQKALSTIPPEQLEVVILKQYEELTFREIADILSLSENTVKSRMYYALKALKKTLKDHPIIKDLYHEAS